jgi:hypothetical protein
LEQIGDLILQISNWLFAAIATLSVASAGTSSQGDAATTNLDAKGLGQCVWDGNHDVAPCVQSAIDTAAKQGGEVTIPAGAWPISRALALPSNTRLRADNQDATLTPTPDNVSNPVLLNARASEHVRVENLRFDGGGGDFANANPVISVTGGDDVVFSHVEVLNTHGIGLLIQGGVTRSGVVESSFVHIGNHWKTTHLAKDRIQGLVFCCGAGNSGNFATHNTFEDIGLDALQFSIQSDFVASGNTFDLENNQHSVVNSFNYPAGIFPMNSIKSVISNNNIRGAQGCGIDAPGLRDTKIIDNTITDSHQCGVGLFQGYDKRTQVDNIEIVNNFISNSIHWSGSVFKGGVTIGFGSPHAITLSGNTITDTQGDKTQLYGVQVLKETHLTDLKIDDNNKLLGNAKGAIDREDIRESTSHSPATK